MGKRWDYGDAGDRYKVAPGDTWEVGPHTFYCADAETGKAANIAHEWRPAMAYTDPPWTAGLASGYRTKAASTPEGVGIATGKVDFPALMRRMGDALRHVRGDVFVEIGKQQVDIVKATLVGFGGPILHDWRITYYGLKPCHLLHTTFSGVTNLPVAESTPSADGMDEPAAWCIEHGSNPGDLVFDPFVGRGLVALEAHRLGRIALGMELNPRRLAVTIDLLVKESGYDACRYAASGEETRGRDD